MRIFNLYHEGNSYQTISNVYNKIKWWVKPIRETLLY